MPRKSSAKKQVGIVVRMDEDLHAALTAQAELEDRSLNYILLRWIRNGRALEASDQPSAPPQKKKAVAA